MKKRIAAFLLAMALMGTALVGCGGGDNTSTPANSGTQSAAGDTSTTGGASELSICEAGEPQTIDPALNTAVDGGTYLVHLFEGLTKMDKDGRTIINGQAKDIQVSEDGLTYTITLRDDIKWSDGQPVTAEDFVYSWQRAVDPATASEYAYMFDVISNAAAITAGTETDLTKLGAVAKDEKTLEVKLDAPCAYFEELLAFPTYFPVRKDKVDGNESWTQDPSTYISNGPYMLKAWNHKENILMEKNPNYYDAANVTNDSLKWVLLEDDAAALAAYKNNEVDFIDNIPVDEYEALKQTPDWQTIDQLGTYLVCFNTEKKPFDDVRVRKALSLAIDRNYIIEKVDNGGHTPATAMVSFGVSDEDSSKQFRDVGGEYWSVKPEDYEKNVEEAKRLLAEAGYPNGEGFPTFEYMYNNQTNHQAIGEALQNMWSTELGINCTLAAQDWNVFIDTRHKGAYEAARHGWLADYNDPVSFLDLWVTGAGNNDCKFSNAEYDKLVEEVKATNDQKVRMEKMHKAEAILMDQLPIAPIYFYADPYLLRPEINGFFVAPLGFKYFMYASKG